MGKTRIEWCDFTINPIKGLCKTNCPYCYAASLYKRYKWPTDIRLDMSVFDEIRNKEPMRVFVCSTHDLFGRWIDSKWIDKIMHECKRIYQHDYIFLTKHPDRPYDWNFMPFNLRLGVTVESESKMWRIPVMLKEHSDIDRYFVSFEPLHGPIVTEIDERIEWVIVGAETGRRKGKISAEWQWLSSIMERTGGRKVFIKNNIKHLWPGSLGSPPRQIV